MNHGPQIAALVQIERRQCNRQFKASWPGAPGIQEQYSVDRVDLHPMRMAGNDCVHAMSYGVDPERLQVMQEVEAMAAEAHRFGFGIAPRPIADIGISPDGGDGRNAAEPVQNLRRADIAGVDNVGHSREAICDLRPQKTVRVRDDSDPHDHVTPGLQCRTSSGTLPISTPSWFVTRMEKWRFLSSGRSVRSLLAISSATSKAAISSGNSAPPSSATDFESTRSKW